MQFDDFELGPALIRNLGGALDFTYEAYGGAPIRRRSWISSVHGRCIDAPEYFRGTGSSAGDITFRVDRVCAIHTDDGDRTENIGWTLGQIVRGKLGLPLTPEPCAFTIRHPANIGVRWGSNPVRRHTGVVVAGAFGYRDAGPVFCLWFETDHGPHHAEAGPAATGWRLEYLTDAASGEHVEDPVDWGFRISQRDLNRVRATLMLQLATFFR